VHVRLVVADDDPAVRRLMGAALTGYTVLEAARGDDALALVRRERPDLLLLDVELPGLDGLAVARALAADPATADIPVVLCSGAGPAAAAAAAGVGNVRAFLPKPFPLQVLWATVEAALARRPAAAPAGAAPRPAPAPPAREGVRVLVVLEQPELAAVLTLALAHVHNACRVRVVAAAAAAAALTAWRPHLAVVDAARPPAALLARPAAPAAAGRAGGRVPLVALARRGDRPALLAGLDGGADDVVAVPCAPDELVARLLRVLRRTSRPDAALRPVLRRGALQLNLLTRGVRLGAATVHLTALEQQLLYLLVANAGRVLTRAAILDHVWGAASDAEPTSVHRHVRTLRAKLQPAPPAPPSVIATVRGRGYTFRPRAPGAAPASRRPRGLAVRRPAGGAAPGGGAARGDLARRPPG
jgi:DNA-binding response OmpR family regulator